MTQRHVPGSPRSPDVQSGLAHTPGPWRAEHGWSGRILIECGPTGVRASQVAVIDKHHHHGGPGGVQEATANAELIAAAPDLLSIAKRWTALHCGAWHVERNTADATELLTDTQAAISKAEGRS